MRLWCWEPEAVTLRRMGMRVSARVGSVAAAISLCSLGACSADEPAESSPTSSPGVTQDKRGGSLVGSTKQGEGSNSGLSGLQEGAASAAEQAESGDGLRVQNRTGTTVILVLADGARGPLEPGKVVTLVMPCPERFPVRVESMTGQFIAERAGPCRLRDTWTVR